MDRERAAFVKLYPEASINVTSRPSREAIRALFAAECDLAVISGDLAPEERAAAVSGKLELEGYRFARDAVVAIVHPSNPVENLPLEGLRHIYEGRIDDWKQLGGSPGRIEPVIPPVQSDVTALFIEKVMNGQPIRARVVYESSDSSVVSAVMLRPRAVGFVSLAFADRGAKVLRLSSVTGLPYWKPDLEAVHRGEYPLTRFLSFYVRPSGPRLANGLITYVTSYEGQRIVREAGLVPTSVPVRFVRRSPMRSTH